jgi:hypothetical protein
MKKIFKILGITVIMALISFSMTACDDGGGGGGGGGGNGPIPLIDGQWKHGELTDKTSQIQYSFSVKCNIACYLWWNDSDQGDDFKTGDIIVSAKFSDGTDVAPSDVDKVDKGWNDYTLIAFYSTNPSDLNKTKTVIITVEPKDENSFGTYSIVYATSSITGDTPRPPSTWASPPASAIPLVENKWKSGTIADSSIVEWDWYTLSVTSGTTYQFWWDESRTDGIFSGNITVTGYYSDGQEAFAETDAGWDNYKSFTPNKSGTVYIRVRLHSSNFGTTYPGTYSIAYSTSTAKPAMELEGNITAVELTADTWKHGTIASTAYTDWYKVSVTSGTTYRFWLSDKDNDSIHTGNIVVTGYQNDLTIVIDQTDKAWTAAKTYTPTESGTLYIGVKLYFSYSSFSVTPGTYGIVYSTSTTRPTITLNGVIDATPLEENTWKDGEIASGGIQWYSMQVTSGGTYQLWSNDSYSGNYAKTGRIYVSGFYSDGSAAFPKDYSLWNYSKSITPGADDTVYIRVTPYNNTYAGTYGIVYSTGSTRPVVTYDVSGAVTLPVNEWKNGQINAANGTDWYSVTVESGKTYRVYWNDSANGDNTKTGNVSVYAYYSDWKEIDNRDSGWGTPISFTPTANGTVYLRVFPYSNSSTAVNTGTYAILCTTGASRPLDTQGISATALTEKQWQKGEITSSSQAIYYKFTVNAGTYFIWWDDAGEGGTGKTADVKVSGYDSNGIASFYRVDNGYTYLQRITVTAPGTAYVLVEPNETSGTGSTGTFGIVYSTNNFKPLDTQNMTSTALTADTWKYEQITSTSDVDWYTLSVTSGTTYRFWWSEKTNIKILTGDIKVKGYYSDGSSAFVETDTAWDTPVSFTPSANGTVYINVTVGYSSSVGTYSVVYSASATRPAMNMGDIATTATALTADTWKYGQIINTSATDWYKLSVTSGTTYRFWWDETSCSGIHSGNVIVTAYYNDGSSAFGETNSAWVDSKTFTPTADSTVYLYVKVYDYQIGTYGIVYSTSTTIPAIDMNILNAVPLTENQWQNGELTFQNNFFWCSFPVSSGTYYIWSDDKYTPNSGTKTADIKVSAFNSDGSVAYFKEIDNAWNTPKQIPITAAGTVYVKVETYSTGNYGTFGVVYSTANSRPAQ